MLGRRKSSQTAAGTGAAAPAAAVGRLTAQDFLRPQSSVLLSSLAINLLGLAMPLAVLQIYDRVIPNHATSTLKMFLVMLAVVFVMEAILKIARYAIMGYGAMAFALSVSSECYSRLLVHNGDFRRLSERNDSLSAVQKIAEFHASQSRLALVDFPFMLINILLMAMIGGVVVLAPILVIGVYGVMVMMAGHQLYDQFRKRDEADVRANDFLTEVLRNVETIKSLGAEEIIKRRHERLHKTTGPILYEVIKASDRAFVMTSTIGSIATIAVLTFGGFLAAEGYLSAGAVACCSLLTGRMMQSVSRIITISNDVQGLEAARQQLQPILDLPAVGSEPLPVVRWEAIPVIHLDARLECQDQGRHFDVDLDIAPGECIVIANPGAAGTLVLRALAGMESLAEGELVFDGRQVRVDEPAPLSDLAFVTRDLSFFNGTIMENMTLNGHVEMLEDAADIAQQLLLDERVDLLPQGYDTPLRDGSGNLLPAGFLKQVVLTRALMRKPKIILLDEPQTYLDQAADSALLRYLAHHKGVATMVIATSRPSYWALADRLYRFEDAGLVLAGPAAGAPSAVPAAAPVPAAVAAHADAAVAGGAA